MDIAHTGVAALLLFLLLAGCAGVGSAPPREPPRTTGAQPTPRALDPQQAERLRRIMVPLIGAMDHPRPLNQVRVGIIDDPRVNAANAGGGEFNVTTGLLREATDEHLQGGGWPTRSPTTISATSQRLRPSVLELGIGMIILDQIIPGRGRITPVAGALIARSYSRKDESEADRHGVEMLRRAGSSKDVMINTLTWLMQTESDSGGGFLATHPGTQSGSTR